MRYQDRVQYEEKFDYLNRAYTIAKNRLEKERKQMRNNTKDKWATAAIIVAAGIFVYLTIAGIANFDHWLQYGWR